MVVTERLREGFPKKVRVRWHSCVYVYLTHGVPVCSSITLIVSRWCLLLCGVYLLHGCGGALQRPTACDHWAMTARAMVIQITLEWSEICYSKAVPITDSVGVCQGRIQWVSATGGHLHGENMLSGIHTRRERRARFGINTLKSTKINQSINQPCVNSQTFTQPKEGELWIRGWGVDGWVEVE